MAVKVSRRREVIGLVNLIESGSDMKHVAAVLAAYLTENHRLRDVELYMRDIRAELENRFGLVSADVKTARKLSDDLEQQISQFIKNETDAKSVEIIETVDKSLVGGVVISTTDAELDNSIRTRLQRLRSI